VTYYWIDIPTLASTVQREELYRLASNGDSNIVLFNQGWRPPARLKIAAILPIWPTDIINTEKYFPGTTPPNPYASVSDVNAPVYQSPPEPFVPRQFHAGAMWMLGYEHCDSITKEWFWRPETQLLSVEDLRQAYETVRGIGGNLLLNVPPDKTGRLPAAYVKRLNELKTALGL
jgi:alpha-L-fucosidase